MGRDKRKVSRSPSSFRIYGNFSSGKPDCTGPYWYQKGRPRPSIAFNARHTRRGSFPSANQKCMSSTVQKSWVKAIYCSGNPSQEDSNRCLEIKFWLRTRNNEFMQTDANPVFLIRFLCFIIYVKCSFVSSQQEPAHKAFHAEVLCFKYIMLRHFILSFVCDIIDANDNDKLQVFNAE